MPKLLCYVNNVILRWSNSYHEVSLSEIFLSLTSCTLKLNRTDAVGRQSAPFLTVAVTKRMSPVCGTDVR